MAQALDYDPLDRPPPSGPALGELAPREAIRILLVADPASDISAIESALAPLGYALPTAGSGEEAQSLLLAEEFALVLIDVRAPVRDALRSERLIRSAAATSEIPIVFICGGRAQLSEVVAGSESRAVDYLLKPIDHDLLRSKVSLFIELAAGRRALKQSEAFLRAAFEAAPVGKTILTADQLILRTNPSFGRLVGRDPAALRGRPVLELCRPDDRHELRETLELVAAGTPIEAAPGRSTIDLQLIRSSGQSVWVGLVATLIEPSELGEPLLLVQWVDLTARRRAERARGELLVEQAARSQAESIAERLGKLQELSGAIESLALEELLPELATRLVELFDAEQAEFHVERAGEPPVVVGRGRGADPSAAEGGEAEHWHELRLGSAREPVGVLRLGLGGERTLTAADRALLRDVADRAAISIRRALLHEREHRIAVELQRGLLPKQLPELDGVRLAAHYQAAGRGAEAGGDWYDAFPLAPERLGLVVGDVAGHGVTAASTMGQLRSVTRAFAAADGGTRRPGNVVTRLNRHQLTLGQGELFTVLYAVIDLAAGTIAWANAGHPPPVLRTAAGEVRLLEGGEGLTGMEEIVYETFLQPLAAGDTVFLYSDGLVERRGESLDVGLERLADAILTGPVDPRRLCEHVLAAVQPPEHQLHDDVTALVARVI